MKTVAIKLPESEVKELEDFLKRRNCLSKSEFVRNLIIEKLEKD